MCPPPPYLQILTEDYNQTNIPDKNRTVSTFNLGWLGRIEGFKTHILLHLIERLSNIRSKNINLKIIGAGKDIVQIKKQCIQHNSIQFQFIEEIPFDHIPETMETIDILFAMGASALDGARNRIPTILVDYSYKKINGLYKFKMIYEKRNYNLGEMISNSHIETKSSLEDLLGDIIQNYEVFSERTYTYWKNNFSPGEVVPKFIIAIESSSIIFEDLLINNFQKPDIFTVLKQKIKDVIKPGSNDPGWIYS